ncbi:NB-ARC domain-containing protein [Streptosporangium sp. NBC_01639]|uniref:AfsR/SARP family transcriptional regulator n=1 Tax=Streptosporangium sp. NBC_01639 TaxID=2975948 RepID=UPI00386573CB|nr:NB-ARC domain-containing protein [Streptosporangium sp. NBC_01639]
MRFGVLGPLQILDGERILPPPGPAKHRAVLAALLLGAGRVVTLDRLVAVVWGEDPPASAEPVLRVYVSALRRLVGAETIRTVPGGYLIAVTPDQVDAHRFEHMVERARRSRDAGRAAEAADELRAALGSWRGPALADVDSGELRQAHAVRLEELRLGATEDRIDLDLALGRHGEVVGELRALVAAYPLRERAWGQLVLALHRGGRRSEALAAYQDARRLLVEELGLEPGPELRAAHDRVLAGESREPGARTQEAPNETPPDIADFTGRTQVLNWIAGETPAPGGAPVHLVLHGSAGSGKSAVAVRAATLLGARFPDGRLYAALRAGDRPVGVGAVLEDLLRSLGCPEGAVPAGIEDRVRLYRSMTATRRLLVVLDDAVGESQVRPLLPTGPGCLTLVTSRSPLYGLEASRAFELGVLEGAESVAMLAGVVGEQRVRAEPQAARRIAELCGGLPLALRIAGSRLARRPGWTLEHLAGRLSDERVRLDELAAGDLAVRSSLGLGYRGLAEEEQRLLRRLGALSAPDVAPWAAAAVFGGLRVDRILEELAAAGLLQERGLDDVGQERYGRHDLTRLYAAERLVEEEGTAARVLAVLAREVLDRVRRARTLLLPAEPGTGRTVARTAGQSAAVETTHLRESARWLAAERGFLVAAVADFHRAGLAEAAWRLAFYLTPFFELRAHHEDWHATNRIGLEAARQAGHRHGEALLLRALGDLHRIEGRLDDAVRALQAALAHFRDLADGAEEARARYRLSLVLIAQDRPAEAERSLAACLTAFESAGDARGRADALRSLGSVRRAEDLLTAALDAYRELGDPRGQAAALRELALLHLDRRSLPAARDCAERALRVDRRLGDRLPEASGLVLLARVARAEGVPGTARAAATEALTIFKEYGDRRGTAHALLVLAGADLDDDEIDGAFTAISGAVEEFDALGDRRGSAEAEELAREARRRRGLWS